MSAKVHKYISRSSHAAMNMKSKGQMQSVLTRYVTNILVCNHISHMVKKPHLAHFGSVRETLDSEIKKGMSMFIIAAAESSEKLSLPFPKPKSSCSLVA